MKKIIFKGLIIFSLLFFTGNSVSALDGCAWKKGDKMITGGLSGSVAVCGSNLAESKSVTDCSGKSPDLGYLCCCVVPETTVSEPRFKLPDYTFQIPIGTLSKLNAVDCTNGKCEIPWISQYILAVYNYGLYIAGALGVLVLMAAGLLWIVSGGDSGKITQAKNLIFGSVTGLILLIGLNLFLSFINPDLVKLKNISIDLIEKIEVEGDSSNPVSLDQNKIATALGVNCETDSVADIVNKSKGKVTYSQLNRGKDGPGNTVYFDCSSFAEFVRKCAKLSDVVPSTASIFSSHTEFDGNLSSLKPGDLIGWPPDKKYGHVLIYLGNNLFGDSHGGSGKQEGKSISNTLTLDYIKQAAEKYNDGKLYVSK